MEDDTKAIPLNAISLRITKGTTPTTLGYPFTDSGINFVKSEAITDDGRIDTSKFGFINRETHEALSRSKLETDDILFSMAGVYLGKTAVVPCSILPANTNQAVGIIRLNKTKADPRFVHYALSVQECRSLVRRSVAQSAQPNFNLRDIGNLCIPSFSLPGQRAIAGVLGALDDKIESNRRTSQALERVARAIFRAWFVDFEPVKAKAAGARSFPGMPQEAFDALPTRFVASELGPVPEGWLTTALFDTANYINGAAFNASHFCEQGLGMPIIKIAELKYGIGRQTQYTRRNVEFKQRIDTGDMLYSWSGSPDTSLDVFLWTKGPGVLNQHIFKIVTVTTAQKRFVYYLLRHLRPQLVEIARNKQTTGLGHVTVKDMKRLMVVKAPGPIMVNFDTVVGPSFDKCFSTEIESAKLATLRDYLLPKLLSGEVRVAEKTEERKT